jgi:purine-binding chemotaxis protein CheW
MARDQENLVDVLPAFSRKEISVEAGSVLEKRAEDLAARRANLQNHPEANHSFIVFQLAKQPCAIPIEQVLKVAWPFSITPVPDVPALVLGIVNIHSRIETALDLGMVLGLGPTIVTSKSHLVVVEAEGLKFCFPTDANARVLEINSSPSSSRPEVIYQGIQPFVMGILNNGEDTITIIDISKVLQSEQITSLCT